MRNREGDPVDIDKRTTLRRFAAVGAISPLAGLLDAGTATASEADGNETREALIGYLATTPGAHFSKVRDDLGLGTGETQYHLERLREARAIEAYDDGEYRRFVPAGRFSSIERRLLGQLRRPTARRLILALLRTPDATGRELADRLAVSPATVSRKIADLEAAGFLDRSDGYRLRRPETIIALLVRYADSFDRETQAFAAEVDGLIRYDP